MVEKKFSPGEVIFSEGEPSEYVVQVITGNVEIVKNVGGKEVLLGISGKGEIVGEMGIFEHRPRNATTRAKDNVTVQLVGEKDFMKMVGDTPKLTKHLLHRLSSRLRATSFELAKIRAKNGDVEAKELLDLNLLEIGNSDNAKDIQLTIIPNNPILAEQIPESGRLIKTFPYIVGRKPEQFDRRNTTGADVHLQLADYEPYRLSRVHFMVQHDMGVFILRDLGSALGTGVNGQYLGVDFPRDTMKLNVGDNLVVAGGADSPFSFTINVPR
jgi:CRP-like cAMP-binding protein